MTAYQILLYRNAETGGYDWWAGELVSHDIADNINNTINSGLGDSDPYFGDCEAGAMCYAAVESKEAESFYYGYRNTDALKNKLITNIFQYLVGRNPSDAELSDYRTYYSKYPQTSYYTNPQGEMFKVFNADAWICYIVGKSFESKQYILNRYKQFNPDTGKFTFTNEDATSRYGWLDCR